MKKIFLFLTALFAFSFVAQAEIVDTFQFKSPADRIRAVELAKSLRCPQCQNQNLVESNSPIAYDLRIEVYKMVDEGKSNEQIIDAMTVRFGDFVNYKPPFQWNTALLWLLPILLLLIAFALIAYRACPQKTLLKNTHFPSQRTATLPIQSRQLNLRLSLAIFGLLFIVSAMYYFSLDRFERVQQGKQLQIVQLNTQAEQSEQQRNEARMVNIQQKLRQDPNDSNRWMQLGELYAENNQFDSALIAYSNAAQISGDKPNILGLAATALYYKAGQQMTPQIQQMLEQALAQDKNEVASLSLLATEAMKKRQYSQAQDYLQQLLDSGKEAVDRRSVIQRMKMIQFLQRGQ